MNDKLGQKGKWILEESKKNELDSQKPYMVTYSYTIPTASETL